MLAYLSPKLKYQNYNSKHIKQKPIFHCNLFIANIDVHLHGDILKYLKRKDFMEEDVKDKKRVSLDLPVYYAQEIKIRASKNNQSIKDWILEAIIIKLSQENLANEE
jgi:hypothetical protein